MWRPSAPLRFSLALVALISADGLAAEPLQWVDRDGYRLRAVTPRSARPVGFTLVNPQETGLSFTNHLTEAEQDANHNLLNGAGLALGDVDGDGWCDVFVCNLSGRTALFRNLGDWKFQEIAASAGVALTNSFARAALFADVDADADLDLLVSFSGKGTKLFRNDGKGKFTDANAASLVARTGSGSMAMADVDGDGDLDLYVTNYGETTIRTGAVISTSVVGGQEVVVGRLRQRLKIINGKLIEYGEPDAFFLNDGKGNFTKVPFTSGAFLDENGRPLASELWDMGLSVMFRDINQDGLPDIYVCNDFQNPDRIWINKGSGRFQAIAREAIRISSHFSMGVDFADLDRDGLDDFFVVDMLSRDHRLRMTQMSPDAPVAAATLEETLDRPQIRRNTLYKNRGDGTYAEIAQYSGVDASDWTWGPVFIDVDLDGFEDLLTTNGHVYDTQDMDASARNAAIQQKTGKRGANTLDTFPRLLTPNYAFHNKRNLQFEEKGEEWGFHHTAVSHGIAVGDLDNDGDQDVVINCLNAPLLAYRNEAAAPRIAVRLKRSSQNPHGVGARIVVNAPGLPVQTQEMIAGGRYLSGDEPFRTFAAGSATNRCEITIHWKPGFTTVLNDVPANSVVEVSDELLTKIERARSPEPPHPLFVESGPFKHFHAPAPWNEFDAQPLLLRKWSATAPSVGWTDFEKDGVPEVVLAGGAAQPITVFKQSGGAWQNGAIGENSRKEFNLGLVIPTAAGSIVVTAEMPTQNGQSAGPGRLMQTGPSNESRVLLSAPIVWGALASADVDRDGELDLFAGARLAPGAYPVVQKSFLFLNDKGTFSTNRATAFEAGLVTGALFSDINNDAWPDLVVSSEGGPIRIFLNKSGKLEEATEQAGLARATGWWNSVVAGDFNNDGLTDLVGCNWGLNSMYRASEAAPFSIYHGDLDQNTLVELIPSHLHPRTARDLPHYDLNVLRRGVPLIAEKFTLHAAYADADIKTILGDAYEKCQRQTLTTFASTLFVNKGNSFEAIPLPAEAQFTPAMGAAVADFDNDGHEDLLLSQNFFGVRPEAFRFDAGRGLLLRGNGNASFTPASGAESGVVIYGEQRGIAVADYDNDGRTDALIAEHGNRPHLLHNQAPVAGLRVRLIGAGANPSAIGARYRAVYDDGRKGPVRELSISGGTSGQNGMVQVVAPVASLKSIDVIWPDGKTKSAAVAKDQKELTIQQ